MGSDEKKGVSNFKKVLIGLGVLYLVFLLVFTMKIINGDSCGRTDYTYYGGGGLQEGVTLDSANAMLYQHNPYSPGNKNINYWTFSFTANATSAVDLHIINEREEVLAHAIIEDGYAHHTYKLFFNDNETFNYIGVKCPLCSSSDPEVTFYEEVLGREVERVVQEGNSFTTTDDKTLDFVISGYHSCMESIKYFTFWFLTGAIMIMIVIGLLYGIDKTEKEIKGF